MCVNIVGIFMHNLMEHAQRKAFIDTRNCIAARLEMEDENEKLVSLSCLQQNLESISGSVSLEIVLPELIHFPGAAAFVGASPTRGHGNEKRYYFTG